MNGFLKKYTLSIKQIWGTKAQCRRKNDTMEERISSKDAIKLAMADLASLSVSPWFWPAIGGHESDLLLRSEPDGTFLIRRSFSPGQLFTLSYKEKDRVRSMRIQYDGISFCLDFSCKGQARARSLEELMKAWEKQADQGYYSIVKRFSDGVVEEVPFRLRASLSRPITLRDHCRKVILENLSSIDDVELLGVPITTEVYLKELCFR